MPQAVRFTEKGETFDVPVAEAAKLADQLEQGSDTSQSPVADSRL